jgi:hypothetical protein
MKERRREKKKQRRFRIPAIKKEMNRRSEIRKTVQRVGNFLIGDRNSQKPYSSMCTKMHIYIVCSREKLRRQYADCVVGIKIHGQWEAYSIWVEWNKQFFDRWRGWAENGGPCEVWPQAFTWF